MEYVVAEVGTVPQSRLTLIVSVEIATIRRNMKFTPDGLLLVMRTIMPMVHDAPCPDCRIMVALARDVAAVPPCAVPVTTAVVLIAAISPTAVVPLARP